MWDASAAAKRYVPEPGSETIDALFLQCSHWRMVFTVHGYSETYAILRRHRNANRISEKSYNVARSALHTEIIEGTFFELLSLGDKEVFGGLPLIDRHNLNAMDATILAAYLAARDALSSAEPFCILIASDHRLLRAAVAEGLSVLDPEAVSVDGLPALLNAPQG